MAESYRAEDMKKERILIPILEKKIKKDIPDVEIIRTDDEHNQMSGSDILMKSKTLFKDDKFHVVDAKGATDFIKKEGEEALPTFAMELISTQKSGVHMGWATPYTDEGHHDKTEYFCFYWVFVNDLEELNEETVSSLEVMIIKRDTLVEFVTNPYNSEFIIKEKFSDNPKRRIEELSERRIRDLYDWMQKEYPAMELSEETVYKWNKNLSVLLKNKSAQVFIYDSADTEIGGPKLVYTSPKKKEERPLNMVIAKKPYLRKMSIYHKILH